VTFHSDPRESGLLAASLGSWPDEIFGATFDGDGTSTVKTAESVATSGAAQLKSSERVPHVIAVQMKRGGEMLLYDN
jgi:phosphotransferase system IIA component